MYCVVWSAGTAVRWTARRGVLRRVTEGDESAATAMVLFVAQVLPATNTLTDRW